jgi:hypothetical protein
MLRNCRVLIAEDEALISLDLAQAVEAANGEPVGPFATVRDGMVYLAHNDVHAAILDVHLADRDIAPWLWLCSIAAGRWCSTQRRTYRMRSPVVTAPSRFAGSHRREATSCCTWRRRWGERVSIMSGYPATPPQPRARPQ